MRSSNRRNLRSPDRKKALNEELDEHTQRVRELMVADITFLEEENNALKMKCLKVEELEEKVELVLSNNEKLFLENQKLANLVEEKIEQCQILRSRSGNYNSNSEYEKNRLVMEVEQLRRQLNDVETMKSLTIKEIQTKNKIQMENMMMSHEADLKIYDEEILKFRDRLEEKDKIISKNEENFKNIENKLEEKIRELKKELSEVEEQKNQGEKNERRLNEEIEDGKRLEKKLREQIEEIKSKNEELKKKMEDETSNSTENKKKLKDSIEELTKNEKKLQEEIEELQNEKKEYEKKHEDVVNQFKEELQNLEAKFKQNFEQLQQKKENMEGKLKSELIRTEKERNDTVERLKDQIEHLETENDNLKMDKLSQEKEIQGLVRKIEDLNILNDNEVNTLKDRLEELHGAQISDILCSQNSHREHLERRILDLEDLLKTKDMQFSLLIDEKVTMKNLFLEEGNQMKKDLKALQNEFKMVENSKQEEIEKLTQDLVETEVKFRQLREEHEMKNTELSKANQIIINQKKQIREFDQTKNESEQIWKEKIEQWKESFFNSRADMEREREKWEKQKKSIEKEKEEAMKRVEEEKKKIKKDYEKLERENESLKEFIGNRDKGIDELLDKVTELNKKLDEREATIDQLREEIMVISQKSTDKIGEQRSNLEKTYQDQLKYIREDYQTRNTILETNLDIALKELKAKENQLEELLRQYEMLRREMITLSEQEAHKKNITLKFPGATANLIATKNMFDVFLKSKVLEVCSDALENKENSHQ